MLKTSCATIIHPQFVLLSSFTSHLSPWRSGTEKQFEGQPGRWQTDKGEEGK